MTLSVAWLWMGTHWCLAGTSATAAADKVLLLIREGRGEIIYHGELPLQP